jgi:hypothetical protein
MTLKNLPGHETSATYHAPSDNTELPTIVCPQMHGALAKVHHPTMTEHQCLVRINEGAGCTRKCKVAKQLKDRA